MEFPQDVMLSIIARLPLVHAVRCKIVSKRLNCLISSPSFWSLRQLVAPDSSYLISSTSHNGILNAFCPATRDSVRFKIPHFFARFRRPMYVVASASGLLCVLVERETLFVWSPITGWWKNLPSKGCKRYTAQVVGMIVQRSGCEGTGFKLFKADRTKNRTILHVFDSVNWKWSSIEVGNVLPDNWAFRQRHNQLVAYFLNFLDEDGPPRLCAFHFDSNQLTVSTLSCHFPDCWFFVNQSSSGRARAIVLVEEAAESAGSERFGQLWEAEEGDELGSWAPWRLVLAVAADPRVIGQSEDGRILYIEDDFDLFLYDMESRGLFVQLGRDEYPSELSTIWTPGTFICPQPERCCAEFSETHALDVQEVSLSLRKILT